MYKNVDVSDVKQPRLKLNYNDMRMMGIGHHPLLLIQMIMKYSQSLQDLSVLDIDDVVGNAEYLCDSLGGVGIVCQDLQSVSYDIFKLTQGLTRVSDDILSEIVSLALRRGLIRWLPKINVQIPTDKRSFPGLPFFACADIKNAAYPIDTPKKTIESHNAIHIAWSNRPLSGVAGSYMAKDFVRMHEIIARKIQQLSINHAGTDSLDFLTNATNPAGNKNRGGGQDNEDVDISPEMTDMDEENEVTNFLDTILTDHVILLRNYISARDELNSDLAKQFDGALDENTNDLVEIIKDQLVTVDIDENNSKKDDAGERFRPIWENYLDAARAMAEGGDSIRESLAKSGLRNLLLAKDEIIKFFVSLFPRVATRADLDEQLTLWVNHLQGYIDFRDHEDYTTSRAHLDDWLKAKTEVAKILAKWTVASRRLEAKDMDSPKKLDIGAVEESPQYPQMGVPAGGLQPGATGISNPPAPLSHAQKEVNNVRRAVTQTGGASPAAPAPASAADPLSAISYKPNRTNTVRETATGHRPYSPDCKPDFRTGKCYKKHGNE